MKRQVRIIFFAGLIGIVLTGLWLLPDEHGNYPVALQRLVSQVFPAGVSPELASEKYAAGRLRVLIVPGHDNEYLGAEFGDLKESNLTLDIGQRLYRNLSADGHFRIFTTRDWQTGDYLSEFLDYFRREETRIRSFRSNLRREFLSLLRAGAVTRSKPTYHSLANEEVSTRLYGINKWANERDIDLAIHLHFNDYGGRPPDKIGRYRGFSIYIPERQLPNAQLSRVLAERVGEQLKQVSAVSNFPQEQGGIVEDQDLIAIGAHGSRAGASFLIEYGYLYEPRFANAALRLKVLDDLAARTAEGIRNYFAQSLI